MVQEVRKSHGIINLPTQLPCAVSEPVPVLCQPRGASDDLYSGLHLSDFSSLWAAEFLMSGTSDLLEKEGSFKCIIHQGQRCPPLDESVCAIFRVVWPQAKNVTFRQLLTDRTEFTALEFLSGLILIFI